MFWQRLFSRGPKQPLSEATNLLEKALLLQPTDFSKPWYQYEYLAVDCEFSSLSVNQGDILSFGWVSIDNSRIQLSQARHLLVKNRATVGQSAAIHSLRDCELSHGTAASAALEELLRAATGKVLLFHHGKLDMGYLNRLSSSLFNRKFSLAYCDTFDYEYAQLKQHYPVIPQGSLTLASCRSRYNLPPYPGHNALTDAIATAELFLAQVKNGDNKRPLKTLLV